MTGLETPTWVKYAGDLFFLVLFLVFFFFFKPNSQTEDEWDQEAEAGDEEGPNPLEQMLVSEEPDNMPLDAPKRDLELSSEEKSNEV
ncbi:MAG: hypothetical protein CVV41_01605 [Candidatus Riflebacteria bacterium HGW-Riflebacteria-1]|jgi:hypothetical protein|nr:MAG: hypothetical protein CVV41_01605 [Candidatus Riflebacteria bacterium HGW-Riflebacteria-1]